MDETNPLADLVTAHCARTGDTLAAIAARGGMARQTLSGLVSRSGPKAFPRHQTLVALAKGLDLPVETVRQLAAEAALGEAGHEAPRQLVTVLVAHAEGLTDEELELVLAVARGLTRLQHSA